MISEINEVTGQQIVDPGTRQKVGQSEKRRRHPRTDRRFTADWIKGSKESKEQAINTHSRFWPRIEAVRKEKVPAWNT